MNGYWAYLIWIVAASALGFATSALFAGRWKLPRRAFLVAYFGAVGVFLYGFFTWSSVDVSELFLDNWPMGILTGLIIGAVLVLNVRSQPASREARGSELGIDIAWSGLIYGAVDGLYLNVMPVLAIMLLLQQLGWQGSLGRTLAIGFLGLSASILVTLFYHIGYPEFRNRSVGLVLFGNAVITMAYLLSGSPIAAVLAHTIMHVAAVLQGPETTIQLPPHFSFRMEAGK